MILAIDVDYQDDKAYIAGVAFSLYTDASEKQVYTSTLNNVMPYQSGQFYKRELPCILKLLEEHKLSPEIIIIDGFVWLDGYSKPGLGAHLYQVLERKIPIIGVAKKSFDKMSEDFQLNRGQSKKPLYITSVGIELKQALAVIKSMHGKHRMPTLLKKADLLCRQLHKG